ncbi:putative arsenical pump membrane protein [Lyophyllum shimeji]|uniref:Arsenical pump membrane protein n=1 Tax=Lyophyllum shimeji TaxID=47721 RepID=A0A9P3PPS5_LYOSH|nr:putative arsenical pump membrane protein [Lyophyllum shimeji]
MYNARRRQREEQATSLALGGGVECVAPSTGTSKLSQSNRVVHPFCHLYGSYPLVFQADCRNGRSCAKDPMITRFSVVTLVIFLLSAVFVIQPVSFRIRLPYLGRQRIWINLTTAPIAAIAILWASQCLGGTQIRDGIVGTDGIKPYNILILFITLAYMAITLDITGVLQAAAFWVSNKGGSNTRKLFFYFYVMLTLISVALGNDPVILSGTAFLVYYTAAAHLEPIAWLMAEFAAANTSSMVLFVGNPTNVVICEGFAVNNAAFTAYTILPFLACTVACYLALAVQFRAEKHLPRKVPVTAKLNVREVLRDPVGALVGSIILGTCLVVIIVVSFFKVDVWKISLPFAVAKLVFDLTWDHYRFVTGRIATQPQDQTGELADDPMVSELKRAMSMPAVEEDSLAASMSTTLPTSTTINPHSTAASNKSLDLNPDDDEKPLFPKLRAWFKKIYSSFAAHFPTLATALPRLPFALIPFAFSQFILIEALSRQGWIDVFARWLVKATRGHMYPTVWLVGVLGVLLCNLAGTNIGATILLTKIVRAAPNFPTNSTRAAAIALALSSNIGAISFTFSASLAGLLWQSILRQKGIKVKQWTFAFWNLLPLAVMTAVGLSIVSAEMAVLYP